MLVARTVRGLEQLAADEIKSRLGSEVVRFRHREVWFAPPADPADALDLRTVDDVFVVLATTSGVGRQRAALDVLASLDLTVAGSEVEVTASFLGRRNYNRFDVEDAVGQALTRRSGPVYHSRRSGRPPAGSNHVRVHIEDDEAVIGLRLGPSPLHRRPYKRASIPGTLHPPVAAAMSLVAGLGAGQVLLDPFCGAGTIPIEARLFEPRVVVLAFDTARPAVAAAVTNAAGSLPVARADAASLPAASDSIDGIVTNPPWDRQVTASSDPAAFWSEAWRVLAPDGRVVVLVEDPVLHQRLASPVGLEVALDLPISLSGRHPHVLMFAAQ